MTKAAAKIDFTAKGNTVGWTSEGRIVTGWKGKDKLWRVQITVEGCPVNGLAGIKLFDTKAAAIAFAAAHVDNATTEAKAWW